MKILFVLEHYYPNIGGVEKLFKELTEELVKKGHDVKVITTKHQADLPLQENINGVKIKRLNLRNRFAFTFLSIFGFWKDAKNADLLHCTSYNAALPAWLAGRIYKKKTIITFHEVWGSLWKRLPYLNFLQRKLFALYEWVILQLKFDYYVSVSNFTKEKLIENGIHSNKIHRIYNGIHYADYVHDENSVKTPFTFIYFGRLGVSKGLNLIIPAAARFLKEHPDSLFKIIIPKTPASFYSNILNVLKNEKIDNKVILMHHLDFKDLKTEILQSSCVLIPSYSEGFCFAAVETSALGTPIITSGAGALRETVSGKYILMETLQTDALYNAILKAYKNEYSEKELIKFTLETSVQHYLKLYQMALSS
jgi:glycosyltransferase involved in cell wall biosynthesis